MSLEAQHHLLHQHEIDLENFDIIDRSPSWKQRLFVKAWHSVRDAHSINEHISFQSFTRIVRILGKKNSHFVSTHTLSTFIVTLSAFFHSSIYITPETPPQLHFAEEGYRSNGNVQVIRLF